MAKLTDWLRSAVVKIVDPEREERVRRVRNALVREIAKSGPRIDVSKTIEGIECTEADIDIAKDRVLQTVVEKIWNDGAVTEKEQATAETIGMALGFPREIVARKSREFAKSNFAAALANAVDDGVIDATEERRLTEIARAASMSLAEFTRSFFQHEAEEFARNVFATIISDGGISSDEWTSMLAITGQLGLTREELLGSVEPQAKSFVEHVLADSKSDGRLTDQEETSLKWLVKNLVNDSDLRSYVLSEIHELKLLTNINDGKLPSLTPRVGVQVNAGEIVHFQQDAIWWETRVRSSGQVALNHQGTLLMTDSRMIFMGATKSQDFSYRRIISHSGNSQYITIQVSGKPDSTFELNPPSTFAYPIFECAVAMAFQTRVAKVDGASTRHIPREIRQRVWQRCGGRCMECGAQDYLEFDHVIPVAKGGSNSDMNVQLLCRRCNLKKSDFI